MDPKKYAIRDHLKDLRRRLVGPEVFNIAYAFLMFLILSGIAFSLVKFLSFSIRMSNQVTTVNGVEVGSGMDRFDIDKLIMMAPRLGLSLPNKTSFRSEVAASPVSPPPVAPPEAPLAAELDVSILQIRVLNGTDVAGLARQWQEKFKQAGFVSIEIGNADSRDYRDFHVSLNPGKKDYLERVKQVIVANGGEVKAETEKVGQTEDFVVVVGAR